MERIRILAWGVIFIFPHLALAQSAKPNFSGKWILDQENSNLGANAKMIQKRQSIITLEVLHIDPQLVIISKNEFQGKVAIHEMKHMTDGKPYSNIGDQGTVINSKSHWEGNILVIESSHESKSGLRQTAERYSLSADGKVFTLESLKKAENTPNRMLVFRKQ
jgi:hypothetical protein